MTAKVKILTGSDYPTLETAINAFLSGKDPTNILAVNTIVTYGPRGKVGCIVTYQE